MKIAEFRVPFSNQCPWNWFKTYVISIGKR
jgi:hypothetical protein